MANAVLINGGGTPSGVPDTGSSLGLLGAAICGIAALKGRMKK